MKYIKTLFKKSNLSREKMKKRAILFILGVIMIGVGYGQECEPPLAVPVGDSLQSFCSATNSTIRDLVAIPQDSSALVKWYQGGVELSDSTALDSGKYYFAKAVLDDCISSDSLKVEVKIITNPDMPEGDTIQFHCDGSKVADLVATPTETVGWYQNGIQLASTVILTNGCYYAKTKIGDCSSSDSLKVTVTLNPTYNSNHIYESICIGDSLEFHEKYFTKEGTYTVTLQTVNNCDSIITLYLTIAPDIKIYRKVNSNILYCCADSAELQRINKYEWGWYKNYENKDTCYTLSEQRYYKFDTIVPEYTYYVVFYYFHRGVEMNCRVNYLPKNTQMQSCQNIDITEEPLSTSNKIKLFPNPAKNELNIEIETDIKSADLQIIELTGKVVLKSKIAGRQSKINISELKTGFYILTVKTENTILTSKFIVE
jgi:hypothetical protein